MSRFQFTEAHLCYLRDWPHLLGHLVGFTKLGPLHSGWIRHCWCNPEHSSLQAHRGGYKTTAVTEVGPVWWLLFHPGDRIALTRKTHTDAVKTLGTIRKMFEREEVRELFKFAHGFYPEFVTKQDSSITFNFKTSITKEGSLDAFGIDTSMTGSHYDKIILDDIITLRDRVSRAERERTKDFVREVLTNIIDPGKQVIHTGTPWHKDDAWAVSPTPVKFDCWSTGVLTPEMIMKKRQTTTPSLFAANYELRHMSSEDALFTTFADEQPWEFGTARPVFHLDAKYDGDHTCALTIMSRRKDGRIQVTGWVFPENVKLRIKWIVEKLRKYQCGTGWNETNPDKGYTADLLEQSGRSMGMRLKINRYSESTNKHIKISSFLLEYWDQLVWDTGMDPDYRDQVIDYREGQEPDDAPDSAASLLRQAFHQTSSAANELWKM